MRTPATSLPTITVVIPSFNQASFLERAIDSVCAQRYPHLELIVVDGGSTDGTRELLERRQADIAHWISEPDGGQTYALNKGFALATGQLRGWLNCDERYRPGALAAIGAAFAEAPDLDLVFGHRVVIDLEGRELGRMRQPSIHPLKYALFASGLLYSDCTFWSAAIHQQTGSLNEAEHPTYAMDFDWFCRLALNVRRWKRVDAYIAEFTEHTARAAFNVPQMRDLARQIRLESFERASISRWRIALASPYYLLRSRFGRLGWRALTTIPSPASVLRVAGYIR